MIKLFLIIGSVGGFLSVSLGAFAAHGLKTQLSEKLLQTFQTGVEYQFFHSLAMILIAILLYLKPSIKSFKVAGYCMTAGMVLFSGSLYLIALTALSAIGMVTPFGGLLFLIGWAAMIKGVWKAF